MTDTIEATATPLCDLDTVRGSALHSLFSRARIDNSPAWRRWLLPYSLAALAMYVLPTLIALATQPVWWTRQAEWQQPVFRDLNILCMALLTVPAIVALLVNERALLRFAFESLESSGVLEFDRPLSCEWQRRFQTTNVVAQLGGIGFGLGMSYAQYYGWMHTEAVGGWLMSARHQVTVAGWIYLGWQVPALFYVLFLYFGRAFQIVMLLKDVARSYRVNLRPFDSDQSGGLSKIGRIGLRNQYFLAVGGLNLVCLGITIRTLIEAQPSQTTFLVLVMAFWVVAYAVVGPFAFMLPLMPFRHHMRTWKDETLRWLADELHSVVEAMRRESDNGVGFNKERLDLLLQTRTLVQAAPVWPFDLATVKQFASAYAIPLLGGVMAVPPVQSWLIELLTRWFKG